MAQITGIDFGTTNSLAAYVAADQVRALTGEDDLPHPSVVWYPGGQPIVGREAKSHLTGRETGVVGDIVRSPKSYMGTGASINVAGARANPTTSLPTSSASFDKMPLGKGLNSIRRSCLSRFR